MGEPAQGSELTVIPESCRYLAVDGGEMRSGGAELAGIADAIGRILHRLLWVDAQLSAASAVPGGAISAAPARSAVAYGAMLLRPVADAVMELGTRLTRAAEQYSQHESLALRGFMFLAGVGDTVREAHGEGPGGWARMLTMPPGRFYAALVRRQLQRLPSSQRWIGGMIFTPMPGLGSPVGFSDIAALGTTGRLLPRALHPVVDSTATGIDRAEAAELARGLAGVVAPGGDVGDGVGAVATGVSGLHFALGHRGFQIEPTQARASDAAPHRRPVRSLQQSLAVMAELDPGAGATYGELRIDRVTSPEGERAWQVFIPGGQGFKPTHVHSLIHSPMAVEGELTPSVAMVAAALREVGAVKGEPIVITGHSHGGITGSSFANNPRLRAEFDVPLVIAAGSPIDRHEIRPDTHIVSIEHTEDPIPGADGVARSHKPGLTRVERTLAESTDPAIRGGSGIFHSHDYPTYVDTARIADGHPELAHVRGLLEGIIPEGRVETFRFRADIS